MKMDYMDLIRIGRKSSKIPSLRPNSWNREERLRIEQGLCVKCGDAQPQENSFLCSACESMETIEDIRRELATTRKIAKNSESISG